MEPSLASYLALSGNIVRYRRRRRLSTSATALGVFMCIELMLNAVNLTFVAFSRYYADVTGQLFVFMVMSVAARRSGCRLGNYHRFLPQSDVSRCGRR
jgi:NADH-quinone oxidoreductase subunit K